MESSTQAYPYLDYIIKHEDLVDYKSSCFENENGASRLIVSLVIEN